jgi:putative lipoprotein (rSAM/lipoprotein system)
MQLIKTSAFRLWVKIISLVFWFLGVNACGGSYTYGSPTAHYKVSGYVNASDDKTAISNIQIGTKRIAFQYKVTASDISGAYNLEVVSDYNYLVLQYKDIDGALNGSFIDKDVTVDLSNVIYNGGDGHMDRGTAEKKLDIELDRKK